MSGQGNYTLSSCQRSFYLYLMAAASAARRPPKSTEAHFRFSLQGVQGGRAREPLSAGCENPCKPRILLRASNPRISVSRARNPHVLACSKGANCQCLDCPGYLGSHGGLQAGHSPCVFGPQTMVKATAACLHLVLLAPKPGFGSPQTRSDAHDAGSLPGHYSPFSKSNEI